MIAPCVSTIPWFVTRSTSTRNHRGRCARFTSRAWSYQQIDDKTRLLLVLTNDLHKPLRTILAHVRLPTDKRPQLQAGDYKMHQDRCILAADV
nr:hypothetical protein CFP56_12884 [Quercus suber]